MVGPKYSAPTSDSPKNFMHEEKEVTTPKKVAHFWETFEDPKLSSLIEKAMSSNFDLQIALEKIQETRAFYNLQIANFFPEIDASALATRSRISQNMFDAPFLGPAYQNFYQLGFDASWEIDVFGKLRREKRSAFALMKAQIDEMLDVKLILASEICKVYFEIRELQNLLSLSKERASTQKEIVTLSQDLFLSGLQSDIELNVAKEKEKTLLQRIYDLEITYQKSLFRLTTLLGELPEEKLCIDEGQVPVGYFQMGVEMPSELLRKRPDIRKAEDLFESKVEDVGSAVADFFPRFNLLGSFGYSSNKAEKWFQSGSRGFSIGPSMNWPILTFGRLRSNLQGKKSVQRQALLDYEKSVIEAFADVEGAFVAYFTSKKALDEKKEELAFVKREKELYLDKFISGLERKQVYLSALQKQAFVQEEVISFQRSTSQNLVALYKALGGSVCTD